MSELSDLLGFEPGPDDELVVTCGRVGVDTLRDDLDTVKHRPIVGACQKCGCSIWVFEPWSRPDFKPTQPLLILCSPCAEALVEVPRKGVINARLDLVRG